MVRNKEYGDTPVENVRNFCTISHVDHGKTTLSDFLIASGGLLPRSIAGKLRALDYLESEQIRGITIEASLASFYINFQDKEYLINLIDTPGHIDFSGKVTDAIQLVDNGLIIVDLVEGVMAQTVFVLNQAINNNIKLILFLNKFDRLIKELQLSTIEIRKRIERIIGEIQGICIENGYQQELPSFVNNLVLIGSATDGWAVNNEIMGKLGNIQTIIDWYNQGFINKLPPIVQLDQVMKGIIVEKFFSPVETKAKYLSIEENPQLMKYFGNDLKKKEKNRTPLVLSGKQFRSSSRDILSLILVLSGQIRRNDRLFSLSLQQWVDIQDMKFYRGEREIAGDIAGPGLIFGIKTSKTIPVGDILCKLEIKEYPRKIEYIHETSISQSIEPVDLKDLERLKQQLYDFEDMYPNLEFQHSLTTGEFILSGIGNLQLEIIKEELEEMGIEVYTSPPELIEYKVVENIPKISFEIEGVRAFITNRRDNRPTKVIYEDNQNNSISFLEDCNNLDKDGLEDEFKTYIIHGNSDRRKIRDFRLEIDCQEIGSVITYEGSRILLKRIIKEITSSLNFQTVILWYELKISCPDRYLGNVIQELNREKGRIIKIENSKSKAEIEVKIQAQRMEKITDTIRRESDGNVLWKITHTSYEKY